MLLRISIRGRVHPSVRPKVRRSVPSYFWTTFMAVFVIKISSTDIKNNYTMSDDEVVASYVPPRYLFSCDYASTQKRLCAFVTQFSLIVRTRAANASTSTTKRRKQQKHENETAVSTTKRWRRSIRIISSLVFTRGQTRRVQGMFHSPINHT